MKTAQFGAGVAIVNKIIHEGLNMCKVFSKGAQ